MKILFSGYHNPNFITITEYIEQAIQTLGHDLIVFDDRQHIIPGRIRRRIKWVHELDLKHINKQFVSLSLNTRPDLVIVTGGHRIQAQSIKTLRENGIPAALWTIDAPKNFLPIQQVAAAYRYVFCQGSEAIHLLSGNNIQNAHWLPMACDPSFHHPVELTPKEQEKYGNNIVFVGSYYPNRYTLFKKLIGFDFGIWGPGWNKLEKTSDLRSHIKGEHTKPSEWIKIYSASKIVLASHYQDPENKYQVFQASPRIFEAMACGAFAISDYQKDVFDLFNDGEHLVGFNNANELIEKIKYFIHHSDEREKIASRGRREVLKYHRYDNRIEELLSIVRQN